jgi:hypothetical protein
MVEQRITSGEILVAKGCTQLLAELMCAWPEDVFLTFSRNTAKHSRRNFARTLPPLRARVSTTTQLLCKVLANRALPTVIVFVTVLLGSLHFAVVVSPRFLACRCCCFCAALAALSNFAALLLDLV